MLSFIMPETATAPPSARRRYAWRSGVLATLVALTIVAMAHELGSGLGLLCAFVVLFALGVYEFIVLIRSLDELQQRLHVLALAIAGGLVASLATLIGLANLVEVLDATWFSGTRAAFALVRRDA